MSRYRVAIYAIALFILVATILITQVSWLMESARIEGRFLSQRVNMALCSAMDALSKDRGLCSGLETCVSRGRGTFELALTEREKQKIDSVIGRHLVFYNIHAPFQTSFSAFSGGSIAGTLPLDQALLYPAKEGMNNVIVQIEIPSKAELVRSKINGTFVLSIFVLIVMTYMFISTVRALIREKRIRKETVDFVNMMAHDLKTPISNISFAVALLNRDGERMGSQQKQFVSIIETETTRLKDRTRSVLGLASIDSVLDDPSDHSELEIHEVINASLEPFRIKLQETRSRIETSLNASITMVKANRVQLSSAIMNLIDNAITYSGEASLIKIRTRNEGNGIRIEIEDNGPGIPSAEQALVFRKAYRVRGARKRAEGFGLGLYLARTSVEKNGGTLKISSSESSGSCFVIELPIS